MSKTKKKRKTISLIAVLFSLIFVYLVYHVVSYVVREKTSTYEVGTVTSFHSDKTFTGLILREETELKAQYQGLVNYFVPSGGRCAVSDIVFSIDETGEFNDLLSSENGSSGLTSDQLSAITADLAKFSMSYNSVGFSDVYTLKSDISGRLVGFLDLSSDEAINSLGLDARYFHIYKNETPCIIEYYTDGFESLSKEDLTKEHFDTSQYKKNLLKNGATIGADETACKAVTSETWSVAIALDEADALEFKDKDRLKVRFEESGIETIALFEEISGADGNTYGIITLTKYMIQYADSRYLTLSIVIDSPSGYKIPNTAITSSEYYAIPVQYYTKGGNSDTEGFFVAQVTTSGESVTFVPTGCVFKNDEFVYVDKESLTLGSVIVMPDSDERCAVSAIAALPGVYNVNQGYAVFNIIEVLDENSEYSIVSSFTEGGITSHDVLLLNAENANEGQKIY